MTDAYESFAEVYDELMDNIPYEQWAEYIISLLHEYNIEQGIIAELGCGTGSITELLAAAGYDMIGIDSSSEMLAAANEKKKDNDILYIRQDMREFELFGTVNAILCVCDSINYLTETADITKVLRLANNYLEAGGLFICDFKTHHYFNDIVADSTIAEDRENVSFIWDNYYDGESHINELILSLFIKEKSCVGNGEDNTGSTDACPDSDNIYRKYQEFHYQRGLTIEDMKRCVEDSGMELVAFYDAFTRNPADDDSERVYVIAREKKQEGKYYTG